MKIYATESGNDVKYPLEHCFSRLVWDSNVCLGKIKIALEFFCRIWCLYCVAKTPLESVITYEVWIYRCYL